METTMHDFRADVEMVSRIGVVPKILEVVCRTTGMGFAALARVTQDRWIACSVLDEIDFGLTPGGELDIKTTICQQIRDSREAVVINDISQDHYWCRHDAPRIHGFQSYISVPVILEDGSLFGTLCAIDPRPARLLPETVGMFGLFAELVARHLDDQRKLETTEAALREERAVAELRDQFIAVLAHDLRTPMRGISCFVELLQRTPLNAQGSDMARIIRESSSRMIELIDNLLDLARGHRGGGLPLSLNAGRDLEPILRGVVEELTAGKPNRVVETAFSISGAINCDQNRIAQLLSNLLSNALAYGSADQPVRVEVTGRDGSLELSVSNTGEPIPAAAMEHLFQPFYRSAVMKNREGLGLGLYIAHEIATAHGGTLDVTSTPMETRFTFRMPAEARMPAKDKE